MPAPPAGTLVDLRGDRWRILATRRFERCTAVHLGGASRTNAGQTRTVLHPFDQPRPVTRSLRLRRVSRRRWVRRLAERLARLVPSDGLRAAARGGIDLVAWQLEPALALINRGVPRLLLADDVGLGKTIEASLVIAELAARHALAHVLIVVPPGLRDQWAGELATRFGIEALVADAEALARIRADHLASVNPWSVAPVVLASVEMVKRPEVLPGPTGVIWDLLVVDEAHAVAAAPERHRAIDAIARRSRRLLLLTATPHAGDEAAFRALCDLGREPGDPPIALLRRTRGSLGIARPRRVHLLRIRPRPVDRLLHRQLAAYSKRVLRESCARGEGGARLAMIVLAKRALSSVHALAASLDRRAALLAADPDDPAVQLALPLGDDEEETPEDALPDRILAAPGFDDGRSERVWLQRLALMAHAASEGDTKMTALTRLVRRVDEPVIVFTEFTDTLERAAAVIEAVRPVLRLHGGLDRQTRRAVLERFADGLAHVLVATDVGGQGLNLQDGCRLVVSVEMPWNPMRLEQRIGRVDRIGQRRRVHAVHLVAAGTPEERVLARLYARLASAERTIGDVGTPLGEFDERAIARAVMAGAEPPWIGQIAPGAPAPGPPPFARLPAEPGPEASAERSRLGRVRRWLSAEAVASGDDGVVLAARGSRRRLGRTLPPGALDHVRLMAVYAACLTDASGALVQESLWPVCVPEPEVRVVRSRSGDPPLSGPSRTRHDVEAAVTAGDPEWAAAVCRAVMHEAGSIAAVRRDAMQARCARDAAIRRALEAERAVRGQPVQVGLFDRTTLDEALRSLSAIDDLIFQAGDAGAADGPLSIAGPPELVLVLVLDP